MLTSVQIANYRGFQYYRMEGFAQVNLFVGKNNSGKTALLEAIHFATTGGDPYVLAEAASRRGEMIAADDGPQLYPDLTHFFHGHRLGPDSTFRVEADNGYPALTVRLVPLPQEPALFSKEDEGFESRPVMGVKIEGATGFGAGASDVALSERGAMIFNPKLRFAQASPSLTAVANPSLFVPTESVTGRRLSQLWRHAILEASQSEVVSAVQIVERDIRQIVYVPPDGGARTVPSFRDFFVVTAESPRPIPLGSFGDGGRRLMTLALSLSRVGEGTLFVDEIDTGLHYSVMSEMWKLVIKRATAANIQVFATTHSWDCIEGLAILCQREPELVNKVAIHKIDRALPNSVAFAGSSIVKMIKSDIDPR